MISRAFPIERAPDRQLEPSAGAARLRAFQENQWLRNSNLRADA